MTTEAPQPNAGIPKQKVKPAAVFLAIVALCVVLVIAGFLWYQSNPTTVLRMAFTPSQPFEPISTEALDYSDDKNWTALPGAAGFAGARPEGVVETAVMPEADVFFIHPTTYLNRATWNAPLDDADANNRMENRVLKMQASAFNAAGNVYAPRYRQATFGAFFDDGTDGLQALAYAYNDVQAAFDNFIVERHDPKRPFILAGHSQGALHALPLLKARIAGTPLADKLIAAYIIGWPVSIEADIGALDGIEACEHTSMTKCIVSHQTFGIDGDTDPLKVYFKTTVGLGGLPRKDTTMLCTNPISWRIGGAAPKDRHLGAVTPVADDAPIGEPIVNFIGANCGDDGFLYLDAYPGEAWQEYKLSGENYHVYDYHMFYMNIRFNAKERTDAWFAKKARADELRY